MSRLPNLDPVSGGQLSLGQLQRIAKATEAQSRSGSYGDPFVQGSFGTVITPADVAAAGTSAADEDDDQDTRYCTILLQSAIEKVTLTANIAAGQTTIPVSAAAKYPPFGTITLQVDSEQMTATYDAGLNTQTWTVTRGVNNTTAAAHKSGAAVQQIQIQVQSRALFPADQNGNLLPPFDILVETDTPGSAPERMTVTAGDASGLIWTVTRGVNNTTVSAHPDYAPVCQRKPAIQTTLNAAIDNQQAVITVNDPANFPPWGRFYIRVDPDDSNNVEEMLVIDGAGTGTWRVARAMNGTTAHAHQNGAAVNQVLPDLVKQAQTLIFDDFDFVQPGTFDPASDARVATHHEVLQFVLPVSNTPTGNGYFDALLVVWDSVNHQMLSAYKVWAKDINS